MRKTTSTNDLALEVLGSPLAAGTTFVTDFQTAGTGRKGRAWVAVPESALLFTTILPMTFEPAALWTIPFWTGLAVQSALRINGISTTLQWPNDLLLNGAKIGGILCVSRGMGTSAWVGCGVGINVKRADEAAYAGIVPPPAFTDDVVKIDRPQLLASILEQFDGMLSLLQRPELIGKRWEDAAKLKGTRYRLQVDGESEPFDAVAQGLGRGGALIVTKGNARREIALADARVIR